VRPEDLAFDDRGLLPAIVQDVETKTVLMLGWVNAEAVKRTLNSGSSWFWSRSRQEYWNKGATSGNTHEVVEVRYDCDADTVLMLVHPAGPTCHTGEYSCFYRTLDSASD
jgi:phosphoribosyl-AMP cyclohydrolase